MSGEEDWEEEWEDGPQAKSAGWLPAENNGDRVSSSLALGILAMVPMFIAYEYGLASDASLPRSQSEHAMFRILDIFPVSTVLLRSTILSLCVIVAGALCFSRRVALVPSLFRICVEGFVAACAFGPIMAYGIGLFGGFENEVAPLAADTGLPVAARVFGAAAFEELLFRVGLFSLLFVLSRRVLLFFGARDRVSSWTSEFLAAVGAALAFAAMHLSVCTAWLGESGESFDAAMFAWRFLAGLLLALLFRWRGPGVAAWTHALFNLALLIGAGPEIWL
ncbi:MAG: membrane protease YdiL (CAAX protease family) [Planctomycetota bacterium]|jgi:membrane protease YdiL (CAAX protease family)